MHVVADRLSTVRPLFDPAPGLAYLDAATYGLPPRPTVDALARALQRWQAGTADWIEEWDREGDACRALFAALIGGATDEVALLPTVSVGVGLIAASLPPGTEVVVPDDEFTSVVFPLLAAEQGRGAVVRQAPFDALAAAIRPETSLVAFSLTRSQDGRTAPLAAIADAAARHGAQVLVDATHAIPFVPVRPQLDQIDYLVCHGYKHLLCPRGVAFLRARRDRWDTLTPYFANWRAGWPPFARSFGGPLTLAPTAARFDVSLAWHAWAGARPSLALLAAWQRDGLLDEVLSLSRRLAAGLGLPAPTSSIVAARATDADRAEAALAAAGIKCAARGGNIRLSPHVYNTTDDIDRAIAAVRPLLA
ncbi:MAG TPA: aminotransferase class V-fold PLP-dependent enzyme [Thermomicrobiales bacterium]|nr:aminotransferase class V-fold PLP-dependent enzyme [Thermomicrobiales bacterium]